MKMLILATAVLRAGGPIAAAIAGYFAEDPGKRARRECESRSSGTSLTAASTARMPWMPASCAGPVSGDGHQARAGIFDRYNITSEQDLVGAAAKLDAARKAAASSSGTLTGTIAPMRPLRGKRSATQSDG